MKSSAILSFFCVLIIIGVFGLCNAGKDKPGSRFDPKLKMDFYKRKCPLAEEIVRNTTWKQVGGNAQLPAKLLRLHFHDCFVRGCDASVLLDTTINNVAEKAASANINLAGFEVIDEIKKKLEATCPGVVSCSDVLALAARDAVSFQFQREVWEVPLGRKDGRVSNLSEVANNLPVSSSNFVTLQQIFESHGLDAFDLVVLSGAHTIGVTHCDQMESRLYNFTGKGDTDPNLDPAYAQTLKNICRRPINPTKSLDMDPGSSTKFDTNYYVAVSQKKGIFQSDAALLTNKFSANLVKQLQDPKRFFDLFGKSMKKLGSLVQLKDGEGEIRKNCRLIN